jgi:hypothetical protein
MVTYVEVPLKVFAVTFNMARTHQDINFNLLFPNPESFNLIIWGA